MLPVLNIGPLALQTPGLVLLIGLWLGLSLAEKFSAKRGVTPNLLYNLAFIALVAGVIGARLAYVFRYPNAFVSSPPNLISLNLGLLDPMGGLAVGLISGAIYTQRKKMALWPTLDALTPLLAVMAITLGLSHLASGRHSERRHRSRGGSSFGAPNDTPARSMKLLRRWQSC